MSKVFNGTTDFAFSTTGSPSPSGPMSCAVWFNKDALSVSSWVMTEKNATANFYRGLLLSTNGYAYAYWRGFDTRNVQSTNTYSAGSWNLLGGTWLYKNVVSVILNGTIVTNQQYSNGASTPYAAIGAYTTGANKFDGKMFWFAKWNVVLSSADWASLYAGASPLVVRPDALAQFCPFGGLDANNNTDIVGGYTLADQGGTSWSDSSPTGLIYPSQQIIGVSQGIITPPPQYNQRQILLKNKMSIQNSRLLIGK